MNRWAKRRSDSNNYSWVDRMSHYRELAYRALICASVVIGLLLLVMFLWYALDVILLIVAGILLAVLLSAALDFVQHLTGWHRSWALAAVIVMLMASIALLVAYVVPALMLQANELSQTVPESLEKLEAQMRQAAWSRWILDEAPDIESLRPDHREVLDRASGTLTSFTSALLSAFIVLFVGVYLAHAPSLYTRGILRLIPLPSRERASIVLAAVGYTLRWWLIGQLIVMSVVGLLTTTGLWLLGVPMSFLLGVLAFLLDAIPNFGPIIAALPAISISLVDSPQKALYVTLLYLAIQQFEGLIVSPLVLQRTISLPPVLTISAQVFMAVVAGPLGVLLAAPLTAVAIVLVKMLYIQEVLNDEIATPEENIDSSDAPALPEPHPSESA